MSDRSGSNIFQDTPALASVEVLGYRCLKHVKVYLSPFAILVGPNASGKSSFLDVLAFLGDVLKRGPAEAVVDRADEFEDLTWMRRGRHFDVALEFNLPSEATHRERLTSCRYAIRIGRTGEGDVGVLEERLLLKPPVQARLVQRQLFPVDSQAPATLFTEAPRGAGWRTVLSKAPSSGNDYFKGENSDWNTVFQIGPRRAALASIPDDQKRFPAATWVRKILLDGLLALQLNSLAMRRPVSPRDPRRFLADGSNLPLVVEDLKKRSKERYREWLKHLQFVLPDLDEISVARRDVDRFRYLVVRYRSGLEAPSWLVSDGTLRILALTLPAYLEQSDSLFLIEEPENGLHPRALEPVFQSLSSLQRGQVLVASHSALMLRLARPRDVLCFARTKEGAADIVRGDEHPALRDWQGEVDLGTLLAAGILS